MYIYFNFSKLNKTSIIKYLNTFPSYSHTIMWHLDEKWRKDFDIIETAYNIYRYNILTADISVLENEAFINKLEITKGLKSKIESHIKSYKKFKIREERYKKYITNSNLDNEDTELDEDDEEWDDDDLLGKKW